MHKQTELGILSITKDEGLKMYFTLCWQVVCRGNVPLQLPFIIDTFIYINTLEYSMIAKEMSKVYRDRWSKTESGKTSLAKSTKIDSLIGV